jgi:uncharacterized protein (DUF488 family)
MGSAIVRVPSRSNHGYHRAGAQGFALLQLFHIPYRRPRDDASYQEDGRVDYEKVAEKDFYQKGISYLHTAWNKQLCIVLMCSEAKPQACHRSKLIGRTLGKQNINVAHIDETGAVKTQEEVDLLVTSGQLPLFDDMLGLSGKKYALPGEEALERCYLQLSGWFL